MEFEVIRRNTTPIMIVEQFLKSLESGHLSPEQKLPPERELARMFGVGRSSVREAIGVLVVMGYLEVIQGKGTFIRRTASQADYKSNMPLDNLVSNLPMADLMEAREILEMQAVGLAAERINDEAIKRMEDAIHRMEESGEDTEAFYKADSEFHHVLAESTDNLFINNILRVLVEQIHRFNVKFMDTSPATKQQTIRTAKQITSHIASGDTAEAQKWMYYHLNEVDGSLKDMVAERKRRGERMSLSRWAKEDEV